ncbi:tyrosine-type recombinase/integrase [Rubellicoccus peritrichatus]|uniref:tyrosine-type recombinase/integrase n=1 Tax=Rubellicoccus peritrichatus TaxID=3080537 RepID=UPI003CE51AF8
MNRYRHRKAGIHVSHATPHGLRHSFGVNNSDYKTPITLLQRWMGHADIRTTQIYLQIWGEEEHQRMVVMWTKLEIHKDRNFLSLKCLIISNFGSIILQNKRGSLSQ